MGKKTNCDKGITGGKRLELTPLSERICVQKLVQASLDRLIRKVDAGLPTDRIIGRGRRRSARTASNIAQVNELICSQENAPGSHKSPREIERETGTAHSSVQRTAKRDLNLKTFKRISGQK